MPRKRAPRGPVAQARLVAHDETGWQLIQLRVQEPPARRPPAGGADRPGRRQQPVLVRGGRARAAAPARHPGRAGPATGGHAGPVPHAQPGARQPDDLRGPDVRVPGQQQGQLHPWPGAPAPLEGRQAGPGRGVARAETYLDWDRKQPEFGLFPIPHRLSISFALDRTGLRFSYRVQNRDRRARLPFGFGLHPYFHVPGDRAGVRLQVPLGTADGVRDAPAHAGGCCRWPAPATTCAS